MISSCSSADWLRFLNSYHYDPDMGVVHFDTASLHLQCERHPQTTKDQRIRWNADGSIEIDDNLVLLASKRKDVLAQFEHCETVSESTIGAKVWGDPMTPHWKVYQLIDKLNSDIEKYRIRLDYDKGFWKILFF
ncbi:MAG: hypothetical protein Q4F84_05545 [Fibrobacter sp.]|nr:hypothetical protein [Fibrobacter sp.]